MLLAIVCRVAHAVGVRVRPSDDDVVVDRVADRNDGGEDWCTRCVCV